MSISAASPIRFTATLLATLIAGSSAIWGVFALWFQAPGGRALKTLSVMQRIVGYLPLSYRLIFSGYLPENVYRVGGLDQRYSLQELRALGRSSERAKEADRSDAFSADIRRGVPGISPRELPMTFERTNHEVLP
jgi:hypothetical protein